MRYMEEKFQSNLKGISAISCKESGNFFIEVKIYEDLLSNPDYFLVEIDGINTLDKVQKVSKILETYKNPKSFYEKMDNLGIAYDMYYESYKENLARNRLEKAIKEDIRTIDYTNVNSLYELESLKLRMTDNLYSAIKDKVFNEYEIQKFKEDPSKTKDPSILKLLENQRIDFNDKIIDVVERDKYIYLRPNKIEYDKALRRKDRADDLVGAEKEKSFFGNIWDNVSVSLKIQVFNLLAKNSNIASTIIDKVDNQFTTNTAEIENKILRFNNNEIHPKELQREMSIYIDQNVHKLYNAQEYAAYKELDVVQNQNSLRKIFDFHSKSNDLLKTMIRFIDVHESKMTINDSVSYKDDLNKLLELGKEKELDILNHAQSYENQFKDI